MSTLMYPICPLKKFCEKGLESLRCFPSQSISLDSPDPGSNSGVPATNADGLWMRHWFCRLVNSFLNPLAMSVLIPESQISYTASVSRNRDTREQEGCTQNVAALGLGKAEDDVCVRVKEVTHEKGSVLRFKEKAIQCAEQILRTSQNFSVYKSVFESSAFYFKSCKCTKKITLLVYLFECSVLIPQGWDGEQVGLLEECLCVLKVGGFHLAISGLLTALGARASVNTCVWTVQLPCWVWLKSY